MTIQNMSILYDNLITGVNSIIPSSAGDEYGVSHVYNEVVKEHWRSTAKGSQTFLLYWVNGVNPDILFLHYHNLTQTSSVVLSWGTDSNCSDGNTVISTISTSPFYKEITCYLLGKNKYHPAKVRPNI